MRGSGKSTVAPLVASLLSMGWVDADAVLERREGRPIVSVFAEEGEAAFRELERTLLLDLLGRRELVVATGGGAVLDGQVRRLCRERTTAWLDAPVEVLAARIRGSSRPSLTGQPPEEELGSIFQRRKPLYQEASTIRIDSSSATPGEIASMIADAWAATDRGGA